MEGIKSVPWLAVTQSHKSCCIMRCLLVTAVLIAAIMRQTLASDRMTEENKNDIEEIARILRETVKADLETLSAQHNKLVENAIDVIDKSLGYVDKFADDLKTHLEKKNF